MLKGAPEDGRQTAWDDVGAAALAGIWQASGRHQARPSGSR